MEASDFSVEDLLDLSTGGDDVINDAFFAAGCSTESSTVTAVDSCNSSVSGGCADVNFSSNYHFTGELCVPYEDMAELEWLSTFVEESFSTEDLHKLHFLPCAAPSTASSATHFYHHHHPTTLSPTATPSVPGKARSKRSRAAPCDWSSRLLVREKSPQIQHSTCADTPSSEVRRCLHCAAEKTPQWRTGPMGPKTLCNACGVRHKSGRLVPEYRPAASPTFVSTKHSNSHRKVMELRRQKELQQQQPVVINSGMFGVSSSSSSSNGEDYLIHHHMGGPDYRQMI